MARSVIVSRKAPLSQPPELGDDSRACEYTVSQKIEGKWKLWRFLLIIGYLVFSVGYFGFCMAIHFLPLGCFTPLFTWIVIFLTWRYVSVSYQYQIVSGEMKFKRILSDRYKKPLFTFKIKDFDHIAPYNDRLEQSRAEAYGAEKTLWAASSMSSPDLYFALFTDADGKKTILYFEVTHKSLNLLKSYNKSTVMSKVRY